MAIFRDFHPIDHDRAIEDRRRHRQLVEDSIKRNLADIVSEESIIGENRKKKIKIPIRGLKEYQFIYGNNNPGVGSGDGSENRGDSIGRDNNGKGNGNTGAGNEEGEDVYETEVTIEEIIGYLFDDLELPNLDEKRYSVIVTQDSKKKSGYQRKSIPPRLAKKRSVVEKLKREQTMKKVLREEGMEEPDRIPFKEEDLRYRRLKDKPKRESNAVVICIMDVSGSMDQTRKYLARSFFFILYQFVKMKYMHVEVVFIAHSTTAKEVTERDFFHKGESGGTYISSGYQKALEVIEQRYHPSQWNVYAFHVSDGDNWTEDNDKAVESAARLCEMCNLFGFIEVMPNLFSGSIKRKFVTGIKSDSFITVTIQRKGDLWPSLKRILKKDVKAG